MIHSHHSSCRCCRAGIPRQGRNEPVRPLNGDENVNANGRHNPHYRLHHGQSLVRAWSLVLFCCLLLLSNGVAARRIYGASELLPRELLFDKSEPPLRLPLVARHESSEIETPTSTTIKPSAKASATGSSLATATQTGAASLPRPFDSSIGTNFTSSTCPDFFNDFLSNQTFNDCLPFSMLLQTSNSFFTASRSLVRLTQTLDATCKVDFDQCSAAMAGWAQEIKRDDRCGADLDMENPVVTQAYNGFVAYQPLYQAACLIDPGGNYCFANAATNASAPTSSYIYYLPLGVQLPGGSRPACTSCLQNTMAIFAEAAANTTQPLNNDYVSAAEQVQMACGPTFVGASVQKGSAIALTTPAPYALGGLIILLTWATMSF